jgi:hypothetical protein
MEQITIQVKDKRKAQAVRDFLQTLDFVESVASEEQPESKRKRLRKSADFFKLAGLWAARDISQESIRNRAWPSRS